MQAQLFDLPLNITIALLRGWLTLRDLSLLDAAQCNRSARQGYLEVLKSGGFLLDITSYERDMAPLMQWLEDRKVQIERVDLRNKGGRNGPGHIAAFLTSVGPSLLDLTANNCDRSLIPVCCVAIASCPRLKVLHLSDVLGDLQIIVCKLLAQRALTLERLAVEDSETDQVFPENADMKNLQYLAVIDSSVDTLNLVAFLRNCGNLLYFHNDDHGGTDDCLLAVAQCCPSLQSLHYGRAEAHSTAGLEAVLLACHDLHTIDFASFEGFTNAHVTLIVKHCRKLKALKLQLHSTRMSQGCFTILAPRLAELRHLAVECLNCSSDDAPLHLLTQHCRQLQSLSLRYLQGCSEQALTALLSALPCLEDLDLALSDVLLTDEMLMTIGKKCPHLCVLNLNETAGYSTKGITAIATGCAALEQVFVSDNDELFSELGLSMWKALRPKLRFCSDVMDWKRWNDFRWEV
jgi:hypothetical protein